MSHVGRSGEFEILREFSLGVGAERTADACVSSRIAGGSPSQPPPESTPESAQAYLFLFLFLREFERFHGTQNMRHVLLTLAPIRTACAVRALVVHPAAAGSVLLLEQVAVGQGRIAGIADTMVRRLAGVGTALGGPVAPQLWC